MSPLPSSWRWPRAALGLVLVGLATLPVYRLAATESAGLAGSAYVEVVATNAAVMWSGALVLGLIALAAGFLLPAGFWDRPLRRVAAIWRRPAPRAYALALAGLAFAVTLWFTLAVLEGRPNLIDAIAQLIHARYLAGGELAGAVPAPEFWATQNTLFTAEGWVSQYPPGHPALLALGMAVGAVEAVGAVLMALTAALSYLTFRRLLPGRELVARVAGLMVALSPFLVAHTGSYMNHGSAATLSVLAVWAGLRSRDGAAAWSALSGLALGVLLATRPLFAVVIGLGVVLPVGLVAWRDGQLSAPGLAARGAAAVAAALPVVALLMAYNAHFFGDALTFGYQYGTDANVGLGFHRDPWGNQYTPLMALALTSGDLTALSLALLEMPIPLVAVAGLWLATTRRLPDGAGILAAWALLPAAANFFYWHHGAFMGPRMLAEAAPPWAGLVALAVLSLAGRLPAAVPGSAIRFRPRSAYLTLFVLGAVAAAWLAPLRMVRRGGEFLPSTRIAAPDPGGPSLVFVHGAWSGRIHARLIDRGWDQHDIETALRQNDLCVVSRALNDPSGGALRALDMEPRPRAEGVVQVEPFPGNKLFVDRRAIAGGRLNLPDDCLWQLRADRDGIIEVATLFWLGDLPGLDGAGPMYVRDMGPEANRELLARYPDRTPFLFFRETHDGPGRLAPYDEGMARLWGVPTEGGPDGGAQ